jgi:probable F420-dependent oxidoreductase
LNPKRIPQRYVPPVYNRAVEYRSSSGRILRIGLYTPILVQTPGGHARWEEAATVEDLRRIAETADRLGYHHLTCSEHIGIPASEAGVRGSVYWDALATLSWLAACTRSIRLATNVLVLGYHHPAELLKGYGTLDRLSAGRLILGAGVGTLREEFDLLGVPLDGRGPRADDALRAIRSGWGLETVEYHGEHYTYGPFTIQPHAPRRHVPVWIGGRTRRSLRRAVELGDGWTPFALRPDAVAAMLAEQDLPDRFDVVLPTRPLDPAGAPDSTRAILDGLCEAGATAVHAGFLHHSLEHYLEQLEAMASTGAT